MIDTIFRFFQSLNFHGLNWSVKLHIIFIVDKIDQVTLLEIVQKLSGLTFFDMKIKYIFVDY